MSDNIGRFMVAMGAIIEDINTGNILLLKRDSGIDFSPNVWEYVTGRLHQFEEPSDGLRREIMEETGLEVEIMKPINIFHIFRGEQVAEKELVGIMYWCRTNSTDVVLSSEHSDYNWTTAKDALEIIEKPSMKEDIVAFMREKNLSK